MNKPLEQEPKPEPYEVEIEPRDEGRPGVSGSYTF